MSAERTAALRALAQHVEAARALIATERAQPATLKAGTGFSMARDILLSHVTMIDKQVTKFSVVRQRRTMGNGGGSRALTYAHTHTHTFNFADIRRDACRCPLLVDSVSVLPTPRFTIVLNPLTRSHSPRPAHRSQYPTLTHTHTQHPINPPSPPPPPHTPQGLSAVKDGAQLDALCAALGKACDQMAMATVVAQACAVSRLLWKGITTPSELCLAAVVRFLQGPCVELGADSNAFASAAGRVFHYCKELQKLPKVRDAKRRKETQRDTKRCEEMRGDTKRRDAKRSGAKQG